MKKKKEHNVYFEMNGSGFNTLINTSVLWGMPQVKSVTVAAVNKRSKMKGDGFLF